jgi:ATP-dependent Clp protease ATP-binding subunit ClpA
MFERFTGRARRALVLAREEASALGHDFLGTEHVLLGLLAEEAGVAATVLVANGLTLADAREAVRAMVGPGGAVALQDDAAALATLGIDLDSITRAVEDTFGEGALDRAMSRRRGRRRPVLGGPPFTPRAKKAIELSLREALQLGHNFIGTEHLLLGILRVGAGVAWQILADRCGDLAALRAAVLEESAARLSTR